MHCKTPTSIQRYGLGVGRRKTSSVADSRAEKKAAVAFSLNMSVLQSKIYIKKYDIIYSMYTYSSYIHMSIYIYIQRIVILCTCMYCYIYYIHMKFTYSDESTLLSNQKRLYLNLFRTHHFFWEISRGFEPGDLQKTEI